MHKTGLRIIYGSSRTKIFLNLQLKIIGYFNGCAKAKSHPYHPQVKLITFVSSSYLFGPCAQSNGLDKRYLAEDACQTNDRTERTVFR